MNLPTAKEVEWFRQRILGWYEIHRRAFSWRQKSASTYVKILSEVLLQRTRAEAVSSFLPAFIRRFPSWKKLALASENDLQQCLQPLGLWRRRAASVVKLAGEMAKRGGRFPATRAEIDELPNVGQYIANAIELFCKSKPVPLLDVNMSRVLERFFGPRKLADIRYDPYLQQLAHAVVTCPEPVLINWAILDHAAMVCKISDPRCDLCPLVSRCKSVGAFISKAPKDTLASKPK